MKNHPASGKAASPLKQSTKQKPKNPNPAEVKLSLEKTFVQNLIADIAGLLIASDEAAQQAAVESIRLSLREGGIQFQSGMFVEKVFATAEAFRQSDAKRKEILERNSLPRKTESIEEFCLRGGIIHKAMKPTKEDIANLTLEALGL